MGESTRQPWTPAYYITTWRDVQAISDPHLKPRGSKRHGPFKEYGDCELYADQMNCTHFSIDKVMITPNIHPSFIDLSGNLIHQDVPREFPQEYPTGDTTT